MFFIKISIPNFISKLLYHISRRLSIIYFLYLLKDIYSPYKDELEGWKVIPLNDDLSKLPNPN